MTLYMLAGIESLVRDFLIRRFGIGMVLTGELHRGSWPMFGELGISGLASTRGHNVTEREEFEAAFCFRSDVHPDQYDIAFKGWQAARRTTPDREAIIEECAKVCDEYAADQWSLYKGRAPYTGSEPGRADPDVQGRSDGADVCAERIRALKTAPNGDEK